MRQKRLTGSGRNNYSSVMCFIINMVLVYMAYALCRVEFMFENWSTSAALFSSGEAFWSALKGSLLFDTSAILYTNILYALLMLIPLHWKEQDLWQRVARWVFVVVNGMGVAMNLCDSVYFQYTGRRTTLSVLQEFSNEGNLGQVFMAEVLRHWYIVLFGIVLIAALWFLYRQPSGRFSLQGRRHALRYHTVQVLALAMFVPFCICGMRGGATTAVRPITVSNANQYVNSPTEAAVILNTPFSVIRTMGKKAFADPQFMNKEEMERTYSPEHESKFTVTPFRRKNVVVLIVESFGREYIGAYNEQLDGGKYTGYAPFVDSLYQRSLSFDYTFSNGRKSIDGMPSILSGIPMFVEPFFLTPASMNNVSGLAGELGKKGYYSAFFHGAENGSMGFQAFARATGFKDYFGRTEYDADKRFGGESDFDGTWAIWDEPFLQFYATKMSEMKEPFVTAVFTASSHHPYVVPEQLKSVYPEEGDNPIHKCIRYTDNALRKFFETASRQPWYKNTIFVLTSDHTNTPDHAEYKTDLGLFGSPILIFDPSGEIQPQRRHCIAQQTDIMPTILGYLGYDNPYVAFGQDLFATDDADTWAVNYINGVYQLVKGDLLIQFDGQQTKAVYNIKNDWMLRHNLKGSTHEEVEMERLLKAIIQQYMQRMIGDNLTLER